MGWKLETPEQWVRKTPDSSAAVGIPSGALSWHEHLKLVLWGRMVAVVAMSPTSGRYH